MEIKINIECDNAPFRTGGGSELARILRELADTLDGNNLLDHDQHNLFDECGNKVGQFVATGKLYPVTDTLYHPADGTPAAMMEMIKTGLILTVGEYRIWAEPGTIVVAADDEDDDAMEFLLTLGGLNLALQHAEYKLSDTNQKLRVGDKVALLSKPDGSVSKDYPLTVGNTYTITGFDGSNVLTTSDEVGFIASYWRGRVKKVDADE